MRLVVIFLLLISSYCYGQRNERLLQKGWKFSRTDEPAAKQPSFSDKNWESVSIPHDWAIKGPFDPKWDKQEVAIVQDGENKATEKTGRTGALPHIGTGWYRLPITVAEQELEKVHLLQFDGAMSHAQVYLNGKYVGEHPYGYGYFYFDISSYLQAGENLLAVRLENPPFASRWYPGAGIYRNVRLISKAKAHIKHWGVDVTTPVVTTAAAKVRVQTQTNQKEGLFILQKILDQQGNVVASHQDQQSFQGTFDQYLQVDQPRLWSPDSPYLYQLITQVFQAGQLVDQIETAFGIRSIEYNRQKGFLLNGESVKFKGVCLHHDLGPLGTAVNKAALRRQLVMMKAMGANAIRTAHNMPAFEQIELCDELGLMVIAESFDEWQKPKVENGYNTLFQDWAKKDIQHLVRALKNHPSIVMWSSGNEVPDQNTEEGAKLSLYLRDIFHQEDPSRPVTVGMDQVAAVMENGFGAAQDIPGLNYRTHLYEDAYKAFPQGFLLGSETTSTVSSRGVYKFPVAEFKRKKYPDFQSSSYDLESCLWSNIVEDDWVLQDDKPWVMGEFVWTGFDYLGEPSPYNEEWPARSSYFGICDLAGIPKDRYYLYRSRWKPEAETLHILPHWNWAGREGEPTPVFVYTNYHKAELFLNGKSQGVRVKNKDSRLDRYRLRWMEVPYEAGELKVVAYDQDDNAVMTEVVRTAGKPHSLQLMADRREILADGQDLSFVTVQVVDQQGNPCPLAENALQVQVRGAGKFKAICNGDPTSLELFHLPKMKAFNGKLVVLVQSDQTEGEITLTVSGKGLKKQQLSLRAKTSW
ncbi:glycoside hydrolase family 2 TIM barrel-domain containing protein [Persicobacter diffluens]|uniref:Beta-galactosidase n=1 Tax=Persicobacter diffluens TaxID=981 RepID=A0AAN4W4C5_9BACT|nr:beta-galactosidase [Persicobacter diffluens]